MLQRRGTGYHFRRSVPVELRDVVGHRELTAGLATSSITVARSRAGQLYGSSERVFDASRELLKMSRDVEAVRLRLVDDAEAKQSTPPELAGMSPLQVADV